jgi:hypothetical protein
MVKPEDLKVGQVVRAVMGGSRVTHFGERIGFVLIEEIDGWGLIHGLRVKKNGDRARNVRAPARLFGVEDVLCIVKQPEEVRP